MEKSKNVTPWDGNILDDLKECSDCSFNVFTDFIIGSHFMITTNIEYSGKINVASSVCSIFFTKHKVHINKIYPYRKQLRKLTNKK